MNYFAYGSNLNTEDRQRKIPHAALRPLSQARLFDYELCFDYRSSSRKGGALNLRPCLGSVVEGMLFNVADQDWEALDGKEGAPYCYQRKRVLVQDGNGRFTEAVTYISERREGFVEPRQDYLEIVQAGCREHGLSPDPVGAAARGERPQRIESVFVYGTLMSGERIHHLLHDTEYVVPARCPGRLFNLGSFPGMLPPVEESDWVTGELVRVPDIAATLETLDRVEGFQGRDCRSNLYTRELVTVAGLPAWTYVYAGKVGRHARIHSGDWRSVGAALVTDSMGGW